MTSSDKNVQGVEVKTRVEASVEECFSIAVDLEAYPEWVEGISSVSIKETDDEGRPKLAHFLAESFGRRSEYLLSYELAESPTKLSWSLVEGDLVREIEGSYVFTPSEADPLVTEVTYQLKIDLAVPLPAFVKRRAEDRILESALEKFKNKVES